MILQNVLPLSEIRNHGQISFMALPENWKEDRRVNALRANSCLIWFHPEDNPDVTIGFFYRGRRAGRLASWHFREALSLPPHDLQATEIESLSEVLDDSADPSEFTIQSARTEWLNRRHVLIVQGRYIRGRQSSMTIYVDADGTGSAIQEIYYAAPDEHFSAYLQLALDAFASIKWK